MTIKHILKGASVGLLLASSTIGTLVNAHEGHDEKQAVLDVVQGLFNAMSSSDSAAGKALVMDDADFIAIPAANPDAFRKSKGSDFTGGLDKWPEGMVESMHNPSVMVRDRMAVVWAPFQFHRQGTLSHCGVNTVILIKSAGAWKISNITYTHETENCEAIAKH